MLTRAEWVKLALLIAAALLVRVAAVGIAADENVVFEYQLIARQLLAGNGYSYDDDGEMPLQPTSLFPPLYVYWCALFMGLWPGSLLPMYLAQALIAALGVIPAWLVGREMFTPRVGWLFAAIYAVYPELVVQPTRPVPEFLYAVIFLWMLVVYLRIKSEPRRVLWPLVLGGLAGVGAMVKEGTLVLLAAILLAIVMRTGLTPRVFRQTVLPALAVAVVIILPWSYRNYVVQDERIVLRTGIGFNLWKGNHEGATGTGRAPNGWDIRYWPPEKLEYLRATLPDDEQDRDRWYLSEAKRFIREHPGRYLELSARRLWYFVGFDPTHPLAQGWLLYRLPYLALLIAGGAGLGIAWRARRLDPVIPLSIAAVLALYVPVLFVPRYRLIPTLMLALLAAVAADWLWSRRVGKPQEAAPISV